MSIIKVGETELVDGLMADFIGAMLVLFALHGLMTFSIAIIKWAKNL